ncbi:Esterase [Nesidiocoris tenuis]|uniref:Carboxylic ester hydrolase n=1 Tax=Nesidiocoris tenuis TaxID=355587 RepID=A0ABN7AER4_9HEMI|nr:Esterase [Nesidiocoris tenuis]
MYEGYMMTSTENRTFLAFSGIRYAKPPIGELRFKPPVPIEPLTEVQKAFEEGSPCIQINALDFSNPNKITGDEDCLFLNIYTHDVKGRYPVMLWIHGGGFKFGSGGKSDYGPEFLMNEDVVLVTINYRLGAFGFASLENEILPGNMGLKDQEEAIRWVKQNIATFGGDPNQITLFGQSAGGASVSLHLKGRMSGLVSRGIAQSGTALCPWAVGWPGDVRSVTKDVATLVGCNLFSRDQQIVECLRSTPPTRLIRATQLLSVVNGILFKPVIEPNGPVRMDPWQMPPSKLPLMVSHTSYEGGFPLSLLHRAKRTALWFINLLFNELMPLLLSYNNTAPDPSYVSQKIRQFYFGDKRISMDTVKNLIEAVTDAEWASPVHIEIERHAGTKYAYIFDYSGTKDIYDLLGTQDFRFGPMHIDDIPYLFKNSQLDLTQVGAQQDLAMSKKIVKMCTRFARGLDPTPEGTIGTDWGKKTESRGYLFLSRNSSNILVRCATVYLLLVLSRVSLLQLVNAITQWILPARLAQNHSVIEA